MWTLRSIETGIRNDQPLNGLTANDVGCDNLIHVCRRYASIPDTIRVDYDVGTMLALVQAACLVGTDSVLDPLLCKFDLKNPLELAISGWIAAAAWIVLGTLVCANEDVLIEFRHGL